MFQRIIQHHGGRSALILAMLILLAIVWSPVLDNGFLTNWDDQWMVLENPYLVEVTFLSEIRGETVATIFTEPYNSQYSPLNTLAYMGIIKIAGQEAFAFHLFSLLVHLANFLLVGFVIQKLLCLIPNLHLKGKAITAIAWTTAFLFAIHPLQVESVAWISASKIVLYSFFYLLGMWFYLLYKQSGKWFYLGVVFFCFLASLLSKEQAVVFVITMVVIDIAISPKKAFKKAKIWIEKIPFLIIAIVFSWATISFQAASESIDSYSIIDRILFANYSFWEYLIKLILPHNLSHFYFYPIDPGEAIPIRYWLYPLATIFFIWGMYECRKYIDRVFIFGALFFLINIVLVLHLLTFPRGAIIADRYIYLSAIGFFLIIVYGGTNFCAALQVNKRGLMVQNILLSGVGLYLIFSMFTTYQRIYDWQDSETLYKDVEVTVQQHTGMTRADIMNYFPCYDER